MPIMDIAKRTVGGALRMMMEIVAGTIGGAIGIVLFVGVGLVRICAAIVSGIGFLGMVFWGAAWILLKKDLAALQAPLIFAALFLAGLAVLVTISVVGDRLKGLGQAKAG